MGGFLLPLRGRLRGRVWRNSGGEYRDTGIEGKAIQPPRGAGQVAGAVVFVGFSGKYTGSGAVLSPCCREQIGRERESVEVYRGPGDMGPGPGRG